MTNTQPVSIPSKEIRRAWIAEISNALSRETSPVVFRALLTLVREEGPGLAAPTNEWWARRFRWIDRQVERGVEPHTILIQGLWDMQFANENDGR